MIPIPDLHLSSTKNLQVGSGGPFSLALDLPMSFDHSGWNVASRSSGGQSAAGASGQGAALAGITPTMIALAVGAYLILKR